VTVERVPGVLEDTVDGAAVIIDPDGKQIIELNRIGSLVWSSIDGTRDVDALAGAVTERVGHTVPAEQIRSDVRSFLDELVSLGLLRAG
jgi:hypothetical protein